jgi:hypothetical protein
MWEVETHLLCPQKGHQLGQQFSSSALLTLKDKQCLVGPALCPVGFITSSLASLFLMPGLPAP